MKRLFGFLLVMGLLPIFVACSSDDDSSDVNLTSDEIVTLLKGKWEVSGELRANNTEIGETFNGRYKGTIEFKDNQKFTFVVTEGDKYYTDDISIYLEEVLVNDNYKYSTLKKDGKNYIAFGSNNQPYNFEIISLKKNSFNLVLNTDNVVNKKTVGRIYMTMYSN